MYLLNRVFGGLPLKKFQKTLVFGMNKRKIFATSSVFLKNEKGDYLAAGNNSDGQLGKKKGIMQGKFLPIELPTNEEVKKICGKSANLMNKCSIVLTKKGTIFASGYSYCSFFGERIEIPEWTELEFQTFKIAKIENIFIAGMKLFFQLNNGNFFVQGIFLKSNNNGARNIESPIRLNLDCLKEKEKIKDINGGSFVSLFLTNQGRVYSFGQGEHGESGLNTTKLVQNLKQVNFQGKNTKKEISIMSIACGKQHSLFLSTENKVYGCGSNEEFQIGLKEQKKVLIPEKIKALSNIIKIECGDYNSFFVAKDSRIFSCGSNIYYQTAGIKETNHSEYIRVPTLIRNFQFIDVYCGCKTTYFINREGEIYSCGANNNCECVLGNKTDKPIKYPRKIKSAKIILEKIDIRRNFFKEIKEAMQYNDLIIKINH